LLLGLLAWGLVQGQGDYARRLLEDVLVMALLGLSLQLMMALGGLVSFGHAAYFALGAYTAAGLHLALGWPLWAVLPAGLVSSAVLAAGMGVLLARSSGVYLAMLSLALAQAIWAGATQWVALTGGDNGLIGLQLVDADSRDGVGLALLVMVVVAWTLLWRLSQSSWGAALQAARDAPQRALASGLPVARLRHQVLVLSAALAGLAGAWWAAIKGAVFPSVASVATSVDALLVVLLGGLHQVWGALVGSTLLIAGAAELGRGLDYWRGWLGLLIMLLMVGAPSGLLSALQRWRLRQEGRS
jgi:branched-chain amino acid transport system permease protein